MEYAEFKQKMKVIHGLMLIVDAGISISMCFWVCM